MRGLRVKKWKWCELIVKVKCGTNHGNNQHHLETCRPKPCAKIFERDDRKWKLNASQWVFWWWCGKDGADDNTERFFGSILCELVRKKSGHMPTSLLNAWQCQCKEIYVKCQYFTESRDDKNLVTDPVWTERKIWRRDVCSDWATGADWNPIRKCCLLPGLLYWFVVFCDF